MVTFFVQLAMSFATGVAGAWIATVQLRSHRVWEQKHETYTQIFDTLSVLQRVNDTWLNSELLHQDISEKRAAELRSEWRGARAELHRYSVSGSFTTSLASEEVLLKLRKELERDYDSAFERHDSDSYELRIAIEKLKRIALHERFMVPTAWFSTPRWLNLAARESLRAGRVQADGKPEEILPAREKQGCG